MKLWHVCLLALGSSALVPAVCFAFMLSPSGFAQPAAVAARADNFLLVDQKRQAHELYRLAVAKAVVILTHGRNDGATRAAIAEFKTLQARYAGKGVEFFLLNSELAQDRDAIAREADEIGIGAPILLDASQLVGEQLGVTHTALAFVIAPKNWQVVYRGPIRGEGAWAADAIGALVDGRTIAPTARPATGRPIEFAGRARSAEWSKISYATTIAPMIEAKCVSCHQEGGVGPMALTSYESIRGFAPTIREAIRTDRMPPFNPDTGVLPLKGDLSLTMEEIRTLVHWIEAGAPRGTAADPLAAKRFTAPEWELGAPDLVLDIPAYTIPASGIVQYQRPVISNPLKEGRWLRASTIKVGERKGVHHILSGYMAQAPADGVSRDDAWIGYLGGYGVGANSMSAPANAGSFMPLGGAIGFQNHYTPFGKEAVDRSQIAFYFHKTKPDIVLHDFVIQDRTIRIPANAGHHTEIAYIEFPKDALLYSAAPHAHYRGSSSDLRIRYPDGKEKLLLSLPRYDFNWQRLFEFAEPVPVPAGSKLIATYTYDNSHRNPGNPDPSRVVTWGEQSFEEMFYTGIRYRWMDETSEKPVAHDSMLVNLALLGMVDDSLDGKLQLDEIKPPFSQVRFVFNRSDTNGDGSLEKLELLGALARMNAQ
jgi:hypothetical protein